MILSFLIKFLDAYGFLCKNSDGKYFCLNIPFQEERQKMIKRREDINKCMCGIEHNFRLGKIEMCFMNTSLLLFHF